MSNNLLMQWMNLYPRHKRIIGVWEQRRIPNTLICTGYDWKMSKGMKTLYMYSYSWLWVDWLSWHTEWNWTGDWKTIDQRLGAHMLRRCSEEVQSSILFKWWDDLVWNGCNRYVIQWIISLKLLQGSKLKPWLLSESRILHVVVMGFPKSIDICI